MRDLTFPAGVKPSIAIKIKQADGTVYTLTDKNIQAGSVSFAFGTSNGGEFTIGGAVIGSFKFHIINRMQIWDSINYINATVEPTLTFGEKTLNMGKYWFVNHKETGSVIVCETYDALQILDEHQIHEDDIVYPTTVQDLAQKIAGKRGFTVTGILNGNIPINDPKNDDMTERECFSYLAQMTGQFVVAKGDTLVFGKYDKKTFHDAGVTFSHDLRTEPISITGVRVYVDDTNNSTGGTAGYMVEIQDNPFIKKENMDSVKTALMNNIVGISFYPGTFSIRANPAIEAGDGLTLTTDKRTVKVYATTITYKLQLQESITADADDYAGDMRLSKRRKISQIAKKAAQNAISEDLKNPDSELSQAIGGGSGGSSGDCAVIKGVHYPVLVNARLRAETTVYKHTTTANGGGSILYSPDLKLGDIGASVSDFKVTSITVYPQSFTFPLSPDGKFHSALGHYSIFTKIVGKVTYGDSQTKQIVFDGMGLYQIIPLYLIEPSTDTVKQMQAEIQLLRFFGLSTNSPVSGNSKIIGYPSIMDWQSINIPKVIDLTINVNGDDNY